MILTIINNKTQRIIIIKREWQRLNIPTSKVMLSVKTSLISHKVRFQ